MPSLDDARSVIFLRLKNELKKMEEAVELLKKLEGAEEDETTKERIQKYLADLTRLVARSSSVLAEALQDFSELCSYFGEPAEQMTPEVLFGSLIKFMRNVETACALACAKEKKKRRHEQELEGLKTPK